MTDSISSVLLSQLSERIDSEMGLHFPEDRLHDLERKIRHAALDFGFDDAESHNVGATVSNISRMNKISCNETQIRRTIPTAHR